MSLVKTATGIPRAFSNGSVTAVSIQKKAVSMILMMSTLELMVGSNVSCQARQAQTTYPGWVSIKLLPMDKNSRFFSHKISSARWA